jgi:DNA-binding NtrC family response regulator
MWPSDMKGQQNQPVRVFLVDEDSHIRNVISQELMRDPRTLLVGQASSYKEARKNVFSQEFDVLLIDLSIGEGQGAELLESIQLKGLTCYASQFLQVKTTMRPWMLLREALLDTW